MIKHRFLLLGLLAMNYPVYADGLPWQTLEFEQRKLWVTASSKITLDYVPVTAIEPGLESDVRAQPPATRALRLQAVSGVANSSEELSLLMQPDSLGLYRKSRLSVGKDRRLKQYRYQEAGILRLRIAPQRGEEDLNPQRWSSKRQQQVSYPDTVPANATVSSASALLLLASRTSLEQAETGDELYLHTDHNIYRARLEKGEVQQLDADFELEGKSITGERPADCYQVEVTPVGELPDKPDFSLLGLEGDVQICVDRATAIPLQVSGRAPRIGQTTIKLTSARRAR